VKRAPPAIPPHLRGLVDIIIDRMVRDIIAEQRSDPARSDCAIAEKGGASHPSVAVVRAELGANGQIDRNAGRVTSSGRIARGLKPGLPKRPKSGVST
jgi:hypothetical protein